MFSWIVCAAVSAAPGMGRTLSLSQALAEALENNPGYQAFRNDTRFAEAARDSALAGYLPTVTATGAYGQSWQDTHQERTTGPVPDRNNAQSSAGAAGVNMNWTLFQGLSAPLNRRRLNLQFEQARAYEGNSKEDLIRKTVLAYADLARQIRLHRALDTVAGISAERVRILERSLAVGAASKSDWLSAGVDFKADQAALLRQTASLQAARMALGKTLGRRRPVAEDPEPVAFPADPMEIEPLLRGLSERRPDLRLAETGLKLAQISARQRATVWFPRLDALAGYNFAFSESDANFVTQSRALGPSVGLQLNFNLFTGEWPWNAYQRARIAVASAEFRRRDAHTAAEADLLQTHALFQASDSASTLEHEGLAFAQENLGLAFLRWKSGSLGYLDARHSQEQYLDAFTRSENTDFDALRSRLDLLRAAGRLESLIEPALKPQE